MANCDVLRLLIVDDVKVHLFLMRTGLLRIDPFMIVDVAASMKEAQVSLTENTYDAVVCDWVMPGGGGHELLQWMRKRPHYNRVPFIMVSARDESADVIQAFVEHGVDDYATKPFTPEIVLKKVLGAIERRKNKQIAAA